jgi:cell division protein FtsZ
MQDDVRVTVVATGLNRAAGRQVGRREEAIRVERPRIVARTGTDNMSMADYAPLGRSAAMRAPAEPAKAQAAAVEPQVDYLDIPAFLRRQAD